MINMIQVLVMEKKGVSDLFRFKIFGMLLLFYVFVLIILLFFYFYNVILIDLVGGFVFMFVMGVIFGEIGKCLLIFNKYIGGVLVMIFLVVVYFVYVGIFMQKEIDVISNVMDKSNFFNLFIVVLIIGVILLVNCKLLLKLLLGYILIIFVGIVGVFFFGIVIGLCFGILVDCIMMLYVLLIMGGGNGVGVVFLFEIYYLVIGCFCEEYYLMVIVILIIVNIFVIIFVVFFDMIGKKYIWFSGEGELVCKVFFKIEDDEKVGQIIYCEMVVGMVLFIICFLLVYVVVKKILLSIGGVFIYYFVWMVLIVVVLNVLGFCLLEIKVGVKCFFDFFFKQLLWVLMVGVGVCYIDL